LTTNSFCPTFINQVIVVNKDHCSNCGWYEPTNSNKKLHRDR